MTESKTYEDIQQQRVRVNSLKRKLGDLRKRRDPNYLKKRHASDIYFQFLDALKEELKSHVATKIGSIAKPDDIFFTAELPKTRSAKIMRRLLRDIAEGRVLGDTTTLADPTVVAKLKEQYQDEG